MAAHVSIPCVKCSLTVPPLSIAIKRQPTGLPTQSRDTYYTAVAIEA